MLLSFNIIVSLLIGVYCTYRWRRLGFGWLSPASLAAFIWSGVWTIHLVDVFQFFEISAVTLLLSLVAVFAFAVGEIAGLSFRYRAPDRPIKTSRLLGLLKLNAWVGLAFALSSFVSVVLVFGNPLDEGVGTQVKFIRSTSGVDFLSASPLFALGQYSGIARAFIYLSLFTLPAVWLLNRPVAIMVGFITIVSGILTDVSWASRTLILDLIFFIFVFLGLTVVMRPVIVSNRRRSLLSRVFGAILVLSVLYIGADRITQATRPDRTASIAGVEIPYSLQQLLVYYSASLVTFDRTIDKNDPRTYGLVSGAGLLNVLHMTRLYRDETLRVYDVLRDWEADNPQFGTGTGQIQANTYSWLRYFYVDLGAVGIVLLPFALGLIAGRAGRVCVASSGKSITACGLLVSSYYVAFRSPIILSLRPDYVVLALILLFLLAAYVTRKRTNNVLKRVVER